MNTAPLEYLLLNPHQKINYRVEREITLQKWYKSFEPKLLEKTEVSKTEMETFLAVSEGTVSKLEKRLLLGESRKVGKEKKFSKEAVNCLVHKNAYLISRKDFLDFLAKGRWYIQREKFHQDFKALYEYGIYQNEPSFSFQSSLKIGSILRQQKEVIESWPTLEDLNAASGLHFQAKVMRGRYQRMRAAGVFSARVVNYYDTGVFHSNVLKLPPQEYQRLLQTEKKRAEMMRSGMTTQKISKEMNMNLRTVRRKISLGKKLGILHPFKLWLDLTGQAKGGEYVLSQEEAKLFLEGELLFPSRETVAGWEKEGRDLHTAYTVFLDLFQAGERARIQGTDSTSLAQNMGYTKTTVERKLRSTERLGFLHPKRLKYGRQEGVYILSAEEASLFASRRLPIINQKYRSIRGGVSTAEIARRKGVLARTIATRIKIATELGLLHPLREYREKHNPRGNYVLSPLEADLLVNNEIVIPSTAAFIKMKARGELSLLAEYAKAGEKYNGITTTELAEVLGLTRGTITERIREAEREGIIKPRRLSYSQRGGKPMILLTEEEARMINQGTTSLRREAREKELISKFIIDHPLLLKESQGGKTERELWEKVKQNDNSSFEKLLHLYSDFLYREAERGHIWIAWKERQHLLQTALYESILEMDSSMEKQDLFFLLRKKFQSRIREEAPSSLSLDRKIERHGDKTFLNFLDEGRKFNSRKI